MVNAPPTCCTEAKKSIDCQGLREMALQDSAPEQADSSPVPTCSQISAICKRSMLLYLAASLPDFSTTSAYCPGHMFKVVGAEMWLLDRFLASSMQSDVMNLGVEQATWTVSHGIFQSRRAHRTTTAAPSSCFEDSAPQSAPRQGISPAHSFVKVLAGLFPKLHEFKHPLLRLPSLTNGLQDQTQLEGQCCPQKPWKRSRAFV